jgi:hypothetical protein
MAEAIRALRNRSVIELDPARAASWLSSTAPSKEGRYYLVRSSIYSAPATSTEDVINQTRLARFDVHWFAETNDAVIVTLQSAVPAEANAHNIAMILRVSHPIDRVFVACYALR